MSAKKLTEAALERIENAKNNLVEGKVFEALRDIRGANSELQTLERIAAGAPPPKLGE